MTRRSIALRHLALAVFVCASCWSCSGGSESARDDGDTPDTRDVTEADSGTADSGTADSGTAPDARADAGDTSDASDAATDTAADTSATDTLGPFDPKVDVVLETADGLSIAGTVHRPQTPIPAGGRPGVLLIHQFNQSQAQWTPHVDELMAELDAVLFTIDLRGHGASDAQNGALTDILTDPGQAPLDVRAALEHLSDLPDVDGERIAVVGTSIGANLACVASSGALDIAPPRLAVALSARDAAVGSLADQEPSALTFGPLFILAAEDDSAGAQAATAQAFHDAAAEPRAIEVVAGSDHGLALYDDDTLRAAILSWLAAHL